MLGIKLKTSYSQVLNRQQSILTPHQCHDIPHVVLGFEPIPYMCHGTQPIQLSVSPAPNSNAETLVFLDFLFFRKAYLKLVNSKHFSVCNLKCEGKILTFREP